MLRHVTYGLLSIAVMVGLFVGCEQKKTRKITVEGPEKKTEFKMETTYKRDKSDE